jgi:hypothetical protein
MDTRKQTRPARPAHDLENKLFQNSRVLERRGTARGVPGRRGGEADPSVIQMLLFVCCLFV